MSWLRKRWKYPNKSCGTCLSNTSHLEQFKIQKVCIAFILFIVPQVKCIIQVVVLCKWLIQWNENKIGPFDQFYTLLKSHDVRVFFNFKINISFNFILAKVNTDYNGNQYLILSFWEKGKVPRKNSLHGKIPAVFIEGVYQWKMPHHWRYLAHERNSYFQMLTTYNHDPRWPVALNCRYT